MTKQRSISSFFPLLIVLAAAHIEPADAKPRDLSEYPLRVHIFQSEWKTGGFGGGQGSGIANLMDGPDIHGFDFSYGCAINYMKSVGNQAYAAKWKKPGKIIEVVGSAVGNQDKTDTCDFKVTLHDYVYDVQNGTLSMFTQEQYKVRMGAALPKTGSVDTDINHYPLRISVLAVDWMPPLNGTRTASGRGNLLTQAGLSSVDFTTSCVFPFPASADGHYYPGKWTREGSELMVLLRAAGGSDGSLLCPLQTSLHTDIYVREASGAIKAVSPEEYRRSVLKITAPVAPPAQDAREPNGEPSAATAGNGGTGVQKIGTPDAVDAQTNVNAEGSGLPKSDKSETTVVVTAPGSGSGTSASPGSAQAAALYRKACDAGSAGGCRNLALLYSAGKGVSQDYGQAAALYRKACNGGDAGSCSNLGLLYSNGTGVPQDYSQAVTLYRKACDAGDGIGCSNLGIMYAQGTGVPKDYTQAASLYRKSCDAGSVISCGNLGGMYANGTGVPQDYGQAVTLIRKACDAGVVGYCGNLGVMYAEGTGVPRDYTQAVTLYRKACEAGVMVSCGNLGSMYANGTGVPEDASQAVPLYRKACDAGLVGACVNLGNLYENGIGVSRDHAQAESLFRKACEGGAVVGCNNLGVMYEKGSNPAGPPK